MADLKKDEKLVEIPLKVLEDIQKQMADNERKMADMEAKNAGQRNDGFDNTNRGEAIVQMKKAYGEPIKEGLSIPND